MKRLFTTPRGIAILISIIAAIAVVVLYLVGILGHTNKTITETDPPSFSEETSPAPVNKEEKYYTEFEKEHGLDTEPTIDEELAASPSHEHKYGKTTIVPSCNREGYDLFECSCGVSYTENIQPMLSHSYTSEIVKPTTESGGYTLHTCSVCGDQYKDNLTDPIKENPAQTQTPKPTEPKIPEGENPEGGNRNPQYADNVEDYGDCPKCGRKLWTTTNTTGCFTFLRDTVCDCGVLVHAMECHHH